MSKFDTLFLFSPKNGDFCTRITPMPAAVRCVGVCFSSNIKAFKL
uniref:Uncharacterized protein n=1 Tax=Myoviridae sp. ctFYw8 TaxID=2825069 RepID=A0A8S5PBW2_9CAUD|nr:MAG TPA: hypothetical protein [Myoviridae sp. ctFYw8]